MTVTRARRLLAVHAIVVLALTLLYAGLYGAAFSAPDAGPDSGVAVLPAYFPLVGLGLPWSCAYFLNPYAFDDFSDLGRQLVIVGPAWANLAVHALVYVVRAGRSLDQPETPTDQV